MGYQQIKVSTGYSLFTVTFKNMQGGEYDIQNITPLQNGSPVETAATVNIQKMSDGGAYLQSYGYRLNKSGWCKGLTLASNVTFKDGEAMCVYNKTGAEVTLSVSGGVELNPWSCEIDTGYSLVGNMTPVEIDVQDIVPYDLEGNPIATAASVNIQKMSTDGTYLQSYGYRLNKNGWCKGLSAVARGTVSLKPGESACLNNKTGAKIKLKFKSPVSAK